MEQLNNIDISNRIKDTAKGMDPRRSYAFTKALRESLSTMGDIFERRIASGELKGARKNASDKVKSITDEFVNALRESLGVPSATSNESNSASVSTSAAPAETESKDDYIEFTYKPGDTFGQKILDLGIGTDNGLWGDNGDVAYYTKQLYDGGYLDGNGNVKLGVPIRLKKRK